MEANLNLNLKMSEDGTLYFYVYDVVELLSDSSTNVILTYVSKGRAESSAKSLTSILGVSHYVLCRMVLA